MDVPALWQLVESLTQFMPLAFRDVVNVVSEEPQLVSFQMFLI